MRICGNLLMVLLNKFGWFVLMIGNKFEVLVGYSTLYGDIVGGFVVIKDVLKTFVYWLVDWCNVDGVVLWLIIECLLSVELCVE